RGHHGASIVAAPDFGDADAFPQVRRAIGGDERCIAALDDADAASGEESYDFRLHARLFGREGDNGGRTRTERGGDLRCKVRREIDEGFERLRRPFDELRVALSKAERRGGNRKRRERERGRRQSRPPLAAVEA